MMNEKKMMKIVEDIKTLKIELLEHTENKENSHKKIKIMENAYMEDITSAVDANGKPLYSNQEKRDIALAKKTSTDKDYIVEKELCAGISKLISVKLIDVEYNYNILKVQEILSKMEK